ncbi:MAG: Hsp70 family protein [Planctomycetota bacterium]|nr:MAG: Hsp70 family protein [Planctomycetota bacterium]REK27650.1 MAG: Hsp70 family protein [Planctomycetota bacterium]REK38507.1 MAG: Hsp70 family protein [Planctomycetota bacterium]
MRREDRSITKSRNPRTNEGSRQRKPTKEERVERVSQANEQPPIGIDLGTTYSVVATLDAQGRPLTIQNAEGDTTTPSVVLFDPSEIIVGREAVKLAAHEPDAVAAYAKRDIGASRFGRALRGTHLPPEVVQSFVLSKLRADAELKVGPIRDVVITVPAYFNEPRRKATQDAGRLAHLNVLDIINEPTAAAIAHGVAEGFLTGEGEAKSAETVLVYDLGGGTFDVTLMRLEGHDYTALGTAGDVFLGGLDWDRRIIDFVAERFAEEHGGIDPREDEAALIRLAKEAEDAKKTLTAREEIKITFEHDGKLIRTPLSRKQFELITSDLVERTRFTCRQVLREANLEWKDISRLLLVGGSSRMPMVTAMLAKESGLDPDRSLAADEAVAHGAAIYAGFLTSGHEDAVKASAVGRITNVSSHDLGVMGTEPATGRPRRRIIIPRNTQLPAKKGGRFATQKDNQKSVVVTVVEGGDDSGKNSTPIGVCKVTDLPANLPAHTPVDVVFKYEENGRITVRAHLPKAGRDASLEITRDSGLSEEDLENWAERIRENRLLPEPGDVAEIAEEVDEEELAAVFDDADDAEDDVFEADVVDEDEEEDIFEAVDEPTVEVPKTKRPGSRTKQRQPAEESEADAFDFADANEPEDAEASSNAFGFLEDESNDKDAGSFAGFDDADDDQQIDPGDDSQLGDFLKGLP